VLAAVPKLAHVTKFPLLDRGPQQSPDPVPAWPVTDDHVLALVAAQQGQEVGAAAPEHDPFSIDELQPAEQWSAWGSGR
jgi:hypothetical protein